MLNPITYTERVVADFLRYQLTTYPLADEALHSQMRALLNLEETRNTPLLRGPYLSLSQAFRQGASVDELITRGILHPHLKSMTSYSHVYGHQQQALEAIHRGRTTLVATGTGSGKTEAFLYPIISHGLRLRDEGAAEGIAAVLVYPMNALAEDQLGRLRELLAGTGVTFGMYVGKTPEGANEASGKRLPEGSTRADYLKAVEKARQDKGSYAVYPPEERISREEMRTPGRHPRILLTNVKQLELLLTRQSDTELFDDSDLRYLVFDEAHTFSGAGGAETACLIRRLRSYCGKNADDVVCVATSATIADPERGAEAGRDFASRFFGVDPKRVELVGESYEEDEWCTSRRMPGPLSNPSLQLQTVLEAVRDVEGDEPSAEAIKQLQLVAQSVTGKKIDKADWKRSLFDALAENEVAYQIAQVLESPKALKELSAELNERVGRPVPEEEILVWLALGATSRNEGRPLMRPVVHGFISGMSGAVVTFPEDSASPKLWLSREQASEAEGESEHQKKLDVTTCTTCGQHYFVHFVADFAFTGPRPSGGVPDGELAYWPALDEAQDGSRLVLTDRVVGGEEDDDDDSGTDRTAPRRTVFVYLCRSCGALHQKQTKPCRSCGREGELVELLAVQQTEKHPGYLNRCLSCGAHGRRWGSNYREPARPVRATAVSDVHVLAQNMLQYAERRRLIIFADNRQDAAFQAGWMQDHARRYRLRALMYERLSEGEVSIGDLVAWLDKRLDGDDDLSRALIPEVWRVARKEKAGTAHGQERRYFLRIQVLREVTNGLRQRIGLEPWGRMRVVYDGLDANHSLFQRWAHIAGCTPSELSEGAEILLDIARRNAAVYDAEHQVLSQWWREGDREVQQGYLQPPQGGPKGVVFERDPEQRKSLTQWVSARGQTRAVQLAKKWQLPDERVQDFLSELWALVAEELRLLVPVKLRSTYGHKKVLPQTSGSRQVDGDRLKLEAHKGVYRCRTCRRTQLRAGPHHKCIQWRCDGTVERIEEDPDNYDLMLLDEDFVLVRPREHSAQVPVDDREVLERAFKGEGELVNTLVATPTLELGVDIGSLDAVLLRNVPPLPANYWQRAGRAGRRHRMAVNLTYAGGKSHDRSYFSEPLKLLGGRIDPPRFNLKNELMVRKHVHATVLSELHQMQRAASGLTPETREAIGGALAQAFPTKVAGYLFELTGELRRGGIELSLLTDVMETHRDRLLERVKDVFASGWPDEDRTVVEDEALARYVAEMPHELAEVIDRLERRLKWALSQLNRLEDVRRNKGTLDPAEEAMRYRCERLVKKLKGTTKRRRSESEGYDDTLTYSVLAAEGFLPGYGLDTGSVQAYFQAPRYASHLRDFQFRRGLSMALREYSPGNYLYANGHRFYPRFFHLTAFGDEGHVDPLLFQVDTQNEAVVEHGVATESAGTMGANYLAAVPISDVDLPHQSHISDDEDYRFQLGVAIFGKEQERHDGGKAFRWGQRNVHFRRQVHLRMVNVGPWRHVRNENELGYPLCLVCGQSRSPFASEAELDNFSSTHLDRCGQPVQRVGFYADDIADAITLPDCTDKEEAYSVLEALRLGATDVLEMERGDLQILVVPRAGSERVNAVLYDPMSGGSGLLDQMIQRWDEVVAAALAIAEGCPSKCDKACVDCLLSYRNSFSHVHLDRHVAADCLRAWGDSLEFSHAIPSKLPAAETGPLPTNEAEAILEEMLINAELPKPIAQQEIPLGIALGSTTPDFFYEDPDDRTEGLCIYLDGLSAAIHGDPTRQKKDKVLREELRAREYDVIEIAASHLTDKDQMAIHIGKIARFLVGKEKAKEVRENTGWFVDADARATDSTDKPSWDEADELVGSEWQPLLNGLAEAGLPVPDEFGVDLLSDGKVSGVVAVALWNRHRAPLALVEASAVSEGLEAEVIAVDPSANPMEVAKLVNRELESAK